MPIERLIFLSIVQQFKYSDPIQLAYSIKGLLQKGGCMESMDLLAWHRAFGQLVEKLDDPSFWLSLSRLLKTHVGFHTWMAVVFSSARPAVVLAVSGEEEGSNEQLLRDYCQSLYQLDPFYIALCEKRHCGLYRLDDVAPDCFTETEYFRRYFKRNVVTDEVQYNIEIGADCTICLSLGSRQAYDARDMAMLTMIQSWLLPLMRQRMHFENTLSSPRSQPEMFRFSLLLDNARLTDREREVSQLMLSGCSVKSIARRLDISIETVRSHKRNLYQKLGVNTQAELFSLFWSQYSVS